MAQRVFDDPAARHHVIDPLRLEISQAAADAVVVHDIPLLSRPVVVVVTYRWSG